MSFHAGPAQVSRSSPRSVELFATLGLALSTLVAATAVSIGIARADTLHMHAGSATDELSLAIAGLLFASMGGLSLLMARRRRD